MKKRWYDYLWIWTIIYFALGFFNILFAWLGLICFIAPLLVAIFGGSKAYCNRFCGRSQLFNVMSKRLHCSRMKAAPRWLSSGGFRYGFMAFFMAMFGSLILQTIQVFRGTQGLRQAVKLFWTFRVPWHWAYTVGSAPDWFAQFSFGFYSLMLTSTLIGLIAMVLYRPRTWCSFCPMGSMTQLICKAKQRGTEPPQM